MGGDAYGCRYDNYVFYYVLTFERRHEETLPSDLRQEEKWKHGRDHVDHQKPDSRALKATDEEKYADQHFEKRKNYDEVIKCDKWQRLLL